MPILWSPGLSLLGRRLSAIGAAVGGGAGGGGVQVADGAVAYWPLNETSGTTAADASGNGNDLTHQGGVTLSADGVTYDGLDGTSVLASLPAWADFTGSYSLELWCESLTASAVAPIWLGNHVANNQHYAALNVSGSLGVLAFERREGTENDTGWAGGHDPRNAMHHYVLVHDAFVPSWKVYVNGVEFGSDPSVYDGDLLLAGLPLSIAAAKGGTDDFANVKVRDVALYDVALTPAQITAHYDAGS